MSVIRSILFLVTVVCFAATLMPAFAQESADTYVWDTDPAVAAKLEQWRDKLIADGDDAINAVIGECHTLERQKLRQLVSRVKKEQAANHPPAAFRELFKYLREHMEEQL